MNTDIEQIVDQMREDAENASKGGYITLVKTDPRDILALLAALKEAQERADAMQRDRAALFDKLNGTPCAEIRWQHERETLLARIAELEGRQNG